MQVEIKLKYYNPLLQIALRDWREVYYFPTKANNPTQLNPEFYRGDLVYRARGESKRYSYRQIKKGLIPKIVVIRKELQLLPF